MTPPAAGAADAATATAAASSAAGAGLENTQWQLVALGPAGAARPVREGAKLTLTLAGGQAGGESGCNSFGGSYTVEGDTLVFGELASTLMACADAALMQLEQEYLLALQSAGRFALGDDQLTIWYDEGGGQLSFAPASAPVGAEQPAGGEAGGVTTSEMAERIEFEAGATSATRSGALPAGGEKQYALTAVAGQNLHVRTVGYGAPVSFMVHGPGVDVQPGAAETSDVNVFRAAVPLPETGDYLITLTAPEDAETTYDVTFTLDTSLSQDITPQPGPALRIDLDPGAGAAQHSGLLPTGPGVEQFVLNLPPDLPVTIEATSDGAPLGLTITGPAGDQWVPETMPAADGYSIGQQFTTPAGGYYLVTLVKADHTPSTNYTIAFAMQP